MLHVDVSLQCVQPRLMHNPLCPDGDRCLVQVTLLPNERPLNGIMVPLVSHLMSNVSSKSPVFSKMAPRKMGSALFHGHHPGRSPSLPLRYVLERMALSVSSLYKNDSLCLLSGRHKPRLPTAQSSSGSCEGRRSTCGTARSFFLSDYSQYRLGLLSKSPNYFS